ncbi:TPA: transporter substrate-binding domain-containing protein [Legionella feeleii]
MTYKGNTQRMVVKMWFLRVILFLCLAALPIVVYANVKVGTVYFYPPYVISTEEGFDIDLMHMLCRNLQEDCQFVPMSFDELYPALDKGDIDIALAGIPIPKNQQGPYIYSLPYMISKAQFLILKGSGIHSMEDLNGKSVGVILVDKAQNNVFYDYLCTGTEQFDIKEYRDIDYLINALTDGSIAAAFLHRSAANYWVVNGDNQFQTLGDTFLLGAGVAMVALPKNMIFIQRINQQLQQMEQDGIFLSLYKMYFYNE